MQQLMGVVIPPTEKDFFELLRSALASVVELTLFDSLTSRIFFPNVYDIRYLMKSCKSLKGTLESDAMTLKVCLRFSLINSFMMRKQGGQAKWPTLCRT